MDALGAGLVVNSRHTRDFNKQWHLYNCIAQDPETHTQRSGGWRSKLGGSLHSESCYVSVSLYTSLCLSLCVRVIVTRVCVCQL